MSEKNIKLHMECQQYILNVKYLGTVIGHLFIMKHLIGEFAYILRLTLKTILPFNNLTLRTNELSIGMNNSIILVYILVIYTKLLRCAPF